ncbi:DUF6119 family protein, partial [Fictibacillus sp. S7]|uniref:DUF6119 family protein n=1 Tax=Fictibacillus sp. S7 TaxID=2212476 RepID=UPI001024EA1F
MKRTKNKNLTIYMLNSNEKNFKSYLREEFQKNEHVKRYYIDKQKLSGNIEKGIIFLYEESLSAPEWLKYLNEISVKQNIKVSPKLSTKAIVFLTLRGKKRKTFALTFGHGSTLLDEESIVSDFGYVISRSLLKQEELISIA